MRSLHFLVIGTNEIILETLVRVITSMDRWTAHSCNELESMFEYLKQHEVNVLLLSSGLEEEVEQKIKTIVPFLYPETAVIEHYGGGSGLLRNEVLSVFPDALANQNS